MKNKIPTTKKDIQDMFKVCRLVFTTPTYATLFLLTVPTFLLILMLPTDYAIIRDVVLFGNGSIQSRLSLLYNLLPLTGGTTYSVFTDVMMYLVSVVVSINIVLLIYHFREHGLAFQDTAGGTLGSVLGVLGSGCASCGSALVTGLFSVLGISGASTLLPLDGGEFLIIALIVSILSVFWIVKGLRGGMVKGCPIE